jgi:hypothetical protein
MVGDSLIFTYYVEYSDILSGIYKRCRYLIWHSIRWYQWSFRCLNSFLVKFRPSALQKDLKLEFMVLPTEIKGDGTFPTHYGFHHDVPQEEMGCLPWPSPAAAVLRFVAAFCSSIPRAKRNVASWELHKELVIL